MSFRVVHPSDTYEADRKHKLKVRRILLNAKPLPGSTRLNVSNRGIHYSQPTITFV